MDLLTGISLAVNQWIAMFRKKYIYSLRNWMLFFIQNLIPIVLIVLMTMVINKVEEHISLPSLEITLRTYDETVTILAESKSGDPNSTTSKLVARGSNSV